jgi:hypothetical protein
MDQAPPRHVRWMQANGMVIAVARESAGIPATAPVSPEA